MAEVKFSPADVFGRLGRIPTWSAQLACGVACAERALPEYLTFCSQANWAGPAPLRSAIDLGWQYCATGVFAGNPRAILDECEQCIPDLDEFEELSASFAQNVATAVCALLDCYIDADIGRLAKVFELSLDSADLYVQESLGLNPRDPRLEERILEHQIMQQELGRQRRDLTEAAAKTTNPELSAILHSRAKSERLLRL